MGYRPDAIEAQLAHAELNSVRRTYNHATYLEERRGMMQAWADKLEIWSREAQVKSVEHGEVPARHTEAGRSLFGERLIAKIQQHRDFKALPQETQSSFFEELAELTLFGTNNCSVETHSPRIRKLENWPIVIAGLPIALHCFRK